MKKYYYLILGTLLLFPVMVPKAHGINMNTFVDFVLRPDNLPGLTAYYDAPAETKIGIIVNFFINLVLYASGGVAVFFLIYGAIQYIISFGGEMKDKAKKTIKSAVIGLIVVILAYAMVTNIISLIYKTTA